ncbi:MULTISPECIES: hypothetical protein [Planomonospora]|nr:MULTISPECIES: hypothetical protein [Planomonospora]
MFTAPSPARPAGGARIVSATGTGASKAAAAAALLTALGSG